MFEFLGDFQDRVGDVELLSTSSAVAFMTFARGSKFL